MVSVNNLGTGNLTMNGGVIESYWTDGFIRPLGSGPGQVQLIGGASGWGNNNGGNSVILGNNAGNEAVWGAANEAGNAAATGFFNPSTLVLNTPYTQNTGFTFQNKIDLNGTTRTIQAGAGTAGGASATISGIIRNTRGTAAGLIKTGPGLLILTAANTYNGGTTIDQGTLRFGVITAMPSSGSVTVNAGATLTVEAGAAGDWTSGASGLGTLGGLFSGLGSAGTSTVSFSSDSTLGLEMTGNLTYAADIPNLGPNVGITKTGGSSLTLTANNSYSGRTRVHAGNLSFNSIGNVSGGSSALGAPDSVANGTINIGSGGTAGTITYTGSGHGSDRVINLSGSTGGATIDSSGTGPLTFTSPPTAAAGAKTLTLGGTNTGANSLPTTTLAGLAEVLTVQKSGAGTWRINGFSSPKNAWSITAGTLLVAGGITTGDQNVTVSGGTLAGVGPFTLQSTKSLTVGAAGSLSPGLSGAGTMAVTGILNISSMAGGTGKLNFEMSAPAASDKIAVTGTAQIGTGLLGLNDFVFTDLGGMTANTYVLISTTGGITGTLDPANRLGSIGSIAGALQINGNNLEFTVDSDLDGIPDSYELANTTPPSATDFNPGDDLDTDGSTNLQEYLAGTNPNNSDSDADGFLDGVETKTGTWVSASNTGTNPLVFDTDGDSIRDGYETQTGIYVSSTDTGTNPNLADTDTDALTDNVETNTGTYVSKTNAGTNPNNPDTDGDGAGDWYEITASFTSPFLAAEKTNIPYPLPDPDGSTGAADKKVRVYIMSGQSNMLGMGTVSGTGDGTLETMTRRQNKFPNLIDGSGNYIPRQDVRYRGLISGIANGPLAPGQGSNSNLIGPELGFGQVMGWYHDAPVLLIKPSIGNRGLGWDILPPGSARFTYGGNTYPAYGESPATIPLSSVSWSTASGSEGPNIWFAGKQYDDYFLNESDMGARPWVSGTAYPSGCQIMNNGVPYVSTAAHTAAAATQPGVGANWATCWSPYSITNVVDVLDNWITEYGGTGKPFAGRDFEIAGFVWWQGEKDGGDMGHAIRYEQNLVKLITSLRSYYSNRYPGKVVPNAPFVLATLGEAALSNTSPATEVAVRNAHFAVDTAAGTNPQVNVKTVYSYPLSEGGSGNGHYNNRAGTYMLVGDALGRAMVDLESSTSGNTFANWIAGYPSVQSGLAGFDQDADGDGIDNGAENFFGTNPGVGSSGLVAGASNGNTFTFTHPQNPTPASGITAAYRWSKDLTTFLNGGGTDGDGRTVNFNAVTNAGITTVTATVTGTAASKLFVQVKVSQN
jgi:autotransporter-associated beta strand protein